MVLAAGSAAVRPLVMVVVVDSRAKDHARADAASVRFPFPPWPMAISLQELELHLYRLRPARPERRSPELAPSPGRDLANGPWGQANSERQGLSS